MSTHIAIDIGGSHGRGYLGVYGNHRLMTKPLGTFSTRPISADGCLCWNLASMIQGIRDILWEASLLSPSIDTIAIDTMGVAFVLLDKNNGLICPPVYTRVPQKSSVKEEIIRFFGAENLYAVTGLEQKKLNSLYYLACLKKSHPEYLAETAHFLMLPDYLNYLLTGVMKSEYTISTTSNLFDIQRGKWSRELLSYTGLSESAPAEPVQCCSQLGRLRPEFISSLPLARTMVVNAPAHDTAAAFFSLPALRGSQLLISSGTWGMVGCISDQPILTPQALKSGFANEGAAMGKIKFLNNTPNMSILEECMNTWKEEGLVYSWETLCEAARNSDIRSIIDLQASDFLKQGAMPERIRSYCRESGQPVPYTPGETARVVFESIAQSYLGSYRDLVTLTKREFQSAVILGGASRNAFLVRLIQEALRIPVTTGSCEAAVMGNLFSQLMASGQVTGLHDFETMAAL